MCSYTVLYFDNCGHAGRTHFNYFCPNSYNGFGCADAREHTHWLEYRGVMRVAANVLSREDETRVRGKIR